LGVTNALRASIQVHFWKSASRCMTALTQTSIEDNKLKAQQSIHDVTLNQIRELAGIKQQLQLTLVK
jgi:hypothetical protein